MTVGKGTVIRDSIIMQGVTIGENCVIDKAIIAEDTVIGDEVSIGIGSEAPNKLKPNIYSGGLATIGEKSVIHPVCRSEKYSHQRCYISGGLCWRST